MEVTLGPLKHAGGPCKTPTKKKRRRSPAYYRRREARRNARIKSTRNKSINAAVEVEIDVKDVDTTAATVVMKLKLIPTH